MEYLDEAARANEALWEREVAAGCGYTIPWLDLDPTEVRAYAYGAIATTPRHLGDITPRHLLADVSGRNVLCLATGGGQQSAVFGLLGARVTVVDLARGQLEGDYRAAAHYGYPVTTIHADMRNLSALAPNAFDLVYGTAVCYVPSVADVYREVGRVLAPGGFYRCDWGQPAVDMLVWDGAGYRIAAPYRQRVHRRGDGGIEYRHYMDDILSGLIEVGLSIREVLDLSRNVALASNAEPGSWEHESAYVGGRFVVVAQKER